MPRHTENVKVSFLPVRIETRFLGRLDHGLVTTMTTISELPRLMKFASNTLSSFVVWISTGVSIICTFRFHFLRHGWPSDIENVAEIIMYLVLCNILCDILQLREEHSLMIF